MQIKRSCSGRPSWRAAQGFTLVELMVTIAIAGILLTLAAPSFTTTLERWRVNAAKDAFASSIQLARREAIKNGGNVLMVRRSDNASCTHVTEGKDWGCGWEICADTNGDGTCSAPGDDEDGDLLLQSVDATKSTHVMVSTSGGTLLFSRWGHPNGLGSMSATFSPHPAGEDSAATTTLCMSSGGRIRFVAAASCS